MRMVLKKVRQALKETTTEGETDMMMKTPRAWMDYVRNRKLFGSAAGAFEAYAALANKLPSSVPDIPRMPQPISLRAYAEKLQQKERLT